LFGRIDAEPRYPHKPAEAQPRAASPCQVTATPPVELRLLCNSRVRASAGATARIAVAHTIPPTAILRIVEPSWTAPVSLSSWLQRRENSQRWSRRLSPFTPAWVLPVSIIFA
jgi:hypothetical protein